MKILVISRHFPPLQSARALQIGKVIAALEQAGCNVRVVAGVPTSLAGKVSDNGSSAKYVVDYVPFGDVKPVRNLAAKVVQRLRDDFTSVNLNSRWVCQTSQKALDVLREDPPDVLMTVFTPIESHMVGLALCAQLSIPWVASFSDPWPPFLRPAPYAPRRLPVIPLLQRHLLRRILRQCHAIHVPTVYAAPVLQRGSDSDLTGRVWAIPHVGPDVWPHVSALVEGPQYIAHIGHLTHHRVCPELLEAIRIAVHTMPDRVAGLLCVGDVCREFKDLVAALRMDRYVRFAGHLSEKECLTLAAHSAALLVIEADMTESPFLPSKFVDYVASGRPIIALTPRVSAVRDYLSESGGGIAVSHDRKEILQAICSVVSRDTNRSNVTEHWENSSTCFSPQRIGLQYLQMFDELCAKKRRGVPLRSEARVVGTPHARQHPAADVS